jgi:hypothetical protein
MDRETTEEIMSLYRSHFVARQKRYKRIAALSYVICGIFATGLIYVLSTKYLGTASPLLAAACLVGAMSSYAGGQSAVKDALNEAYGMQTFDTIKPEDLEEM